MFGSNPFGQSTSSPFGSQPAFGQTNTATSNPFAPKPFGSTSPFSSQTGSIFGSTSALGSSSAFGSPTPAFSAQSASAFGSSSTASGGSSLFGQKPAFGGFGTSTTQTSPFGGSFQQSQPAFGSSVFGSSSPFGAPSQPSFGSMSTPAFGTSTPAFGSSASPVFGSTTGGFGLSTPFGTSTPAFGTTSTPAFGATSSPSFGSAPAFGSTSIPLFGSSSSPAFGTTGVLGFGTATASSFNVSSSPAFGQSTSAFGSSPFGATSAFGAQTTSFGTQTTSPGFGVFVQSTFGVQRGGSRVTPYTQVAETDGTSGSQTAGKLLSISAMPAYKEKSHEELRWEDYQLGDKGGQAPASQPTGFSSPGFVSTSPAFAQSSSNLFSSSSSNPFAPKTPTFSTSSFAPTTTSQFSPSPFPTSNVFSSTASASTPLFSTATQSGGLSTSLFNTSSTPGFAQQSIFGPPSAPGSTPTGLNFPSTQSSPLFQSTTQSPLQTSSLFSQTPPFSQTSSWMSQPSLFSAPSTGFSNLFSSTSSLFSQPMTSLSTPFQSAQPSQTSLGFNVSSSGLSQSGGFPGMFSNVPTGQLSSNVQGAAVSQVAPVTNPFGTLPAMPQMSIGRSGVSPSIQYGISSMPVVDKPAPVRISSLLTSRHIPQRRLRLPVRKYNPKTSGPKVPFFSDDEETPSTPRADAFFVPRENPRDLVIPPIDLWPPRSADKIKTAVPHEFENGKSLPHDNKTNGKDDISQEPKDDGQAKEQFTYSSGKQKSGGVPSTDQRKTRAGESAVSTEPGSDIKSPLPKHSHSDYYTEPGIQELAAKERAEPGFCSHVKNFVVGRKGYGSIKFFDETDVRGLDLESIVQIVQFNDREVLVYMDDSRKPPVGQGLNKPAEITLLNIRCIDKKTRQACTEGPRIDKYKAILRKKAEDQGAEFVSFDPAKSEWKFRVNHFSSYRFEDDA